MKEKKKIDIMAKLFLFLSGLKEEQRKEYSSVECKRNIVYLFDSYFDFRNYFESNTQGVIDDKLLEICILKTTKKGTLIAFKGLCDYTIGLINSKQKVEDNSLEDEESVSEDSKIHVEEKICSFEEIVEQVKKDDVLDEGTNIDITEDEKKFVKKQHDLLLSGRGIVLLKPMKKEKRNIIHMLIKEYSDIASFSIGSGELKYIVLRYKPYVSERKNIKELVKLGNLAYKAGKYDECIEYYLQLLQLGKPKANIYAKLGLSYMKKNLKDIAIDYLIVANELSKEEGNVFDFEDLIFGLNGDISVEDRKPRFKMNIEDFDNPLVDNYGIENIDEITAYILDSGLDVVSACLKLGMSYEQIDIVRLIYARDFYSQGNDIKGDQFLKAVEMSKNKTKFTLKILEEIKRNKKLYTNRFNDQSKVLSLKLQPKKSK